MASLSLRPTGSLIALALILWAGTIAVLAAAGGLATIPGPGIAVLVALGIVIPTCAYFLLPAVRRWAEAFGLRALTALHIWRIGAALLFFHYGAHGALPERFVLHAAWGDLIAGLAALVVVVLPFSRGRYFAMHLFGMADFLLAVGTGLTFTLLAPEAMDAVRTLPLALIPLFGVGISGATHIVALDLLLRGRGVPSGRRQ